MFRWVTKKDLTYWIIILVFNWLLTSSYEITLSKWSFAGTIISIILAVLAIIYTYEQSSSTFYSNKKLEESAVKIEKVTHILEKTSINDLFNNLESRIESLNSIFDEKMESRLSAHHKGIEMLINSRQKSIENNFVILNKDEWRQYLINNLTENTIEGAVLIYSYLVYKSDLNFDLEALSKNISDKTQTLKENKKALENILKNLFRGSFDAFKSLNVFSEYEDRKINKITSISSFFEEAMDELLTSDTILSEFVNDIKNFVETEKVTK